MKRFKKDDYAKREKTRQENIERDDKLAREEEKLAREEEKLAREEENLAREKENLAREKETLAREKETLAREKETLAREKETLARDNTPAREKKAIQNISTGTPTPARVSTASQVFTSAYTQSAHHQRNLGIITKSESSMADSKPGSQGQGAGNQQGAFKMTKELKQLALISWKDLLVSTRDYVPFHVRTAQAYESSIKLLKRAMLHYKEHKPPGEQCVSWDHNYFRELQQKYYIPQAYCDPEMYFQNLKRDSCFAYYNRPCSVREYYDLACQDTPEYVAKHGMAAKQARKYSAPIAHNPFNPGFQRGQASPPKFDEDV